MRFEIKNIKYRTGYSDGAPQTSLEVEFDIYTQENAPNDFTTWIELPLPYSKNLSLGEIEDKVIEIAKERIKAASSQI